VHERQDYDRLPLDDAVTLHLAFDVTRKRTACAAAIMSSMATRSWLRRPGAMTFAPAAPEKAFKKCCLRSGHFDGSERKYYVRD
jgi:hypothetical protein